MPLFDSTAKRLRDRPSILFPADPAGALDDLLHQYDPAMKSSPDRLAFGNGVRLYGPIQVTPDIERKASLPPGMTTAYYTVVAFGAEAKGKPEPLMWQDAERLIHGLAARLGGTVHEKQPPDYQRLEVTVFSPQPFPVDQVITALQPFVNTGQLVAEDNSDTPGSYALGTEEQPPFFVVYWPPRISTTMRGLPPPALAGRCGPEPCRWILNGFAPPEETPRDIALSIAEAALALATATNGQAIDPYGFPLTHPQDLLPPTR